MKGGIRIAGITLALAGTGMFLFWLHREANGFRNAFSINYWADRMAGADLYSHTNWVLKHGNRRLPEVALTFDDGPHPQSARKILAVLQKHKLHATFFLVGTRIVEHPDIVREIVDQGNEVGNHSFTHPRLSTLPIRQIEKELNECNDAFRAATGSELYLMRPPGMRYNETVFGVARMLGYVTVSWTTAAKDFTSLSPDVVETRVLDHLENGSIILLHDCPATADALDVMLTEIERRGYQVVPVTEMLAHLPRPVYVRTNAVQNTIASTVPAGNP